MLRTGARQHRQRFDENSVDSCVWLTPRKKSPTSGVALSRYRGFRSVFERLVSVRESTYHLRRAPDLLQQRSRGLLQSSKKLSTTTLLGEKKKEFLWQKRKLTKQRGAATDDLHLGAKKRQRTTGIAVKTGGGILLQCFTAALNRKGEAI